MSEKKSWGTAGYFFARAPNQYTEKKTHREILELLIKFQKEVVEELKKKVLR